MRVWLIGAGKAAIIALRQLRKVEDIEIIVTAETDSPPAVKEGALGKVDFIETVTALNINALARRIRPDLILVDPGVNSIGRVAGGAAFNQAMLDEMAGNSDYPCILLGSS